MMVPRISLLTLWVGYLVFVSLGQRSAAIVLNEVMVSNSGIILDEDGDSADWIELLNTGHDSVNLEGYGLSDRDALSNRWVFGSYVLPPQTPLVVFASGKDRQSLTDESGQVAIENLKGGLSFWLVAEDLVAEAQEGEVTAWTSRADSDITLVRREGQSGPRWIGGVLNGRAVVRFEDGGGQGLDATRVNAGAVGGNASLTLFIVQRAAPPRHNGSAFFFQTASGRRINFHGLWSDGVLYFDFGRVEANGRIATAPPGGFLGQWRLVTLIRDPSGKGKIFVNGSLVSEGTMTSELIPGEGGTLTVGGFDFQGDIAEIVLAPNAYTDVDRRRMEGHLAVKYDLPYRGRVFHTDFKLKSGEFVILSDVSGDEIDRLTTEGLRTDQSIGRTGGMDRQGYSEWPTPGMMNAVEFRSASPGAPRLSHPSGFYSDSFFLQWEHEDPSVVVRYTMDGSDPTSDSPVLPTERLIEAGGEARLSGIPTNPVMHRDEEGMFSMPEVRRQDFGWLPPARSVPRAVVFKARAFEEGALPGAIVSRTFFIGEPFLEPLPTPVVAITMDPEEWFGPDEGLYVPGKRYDPASWRHRFWGTGNYFIKGRHSERPIWLEVFESGTIRLSGRTGLRIHGGGSRAQPQKALRLTARKSLGLESLDLGRRDGRDENGYRQLLLRNSGQDSVWYPTLIRDSVIQASAPSTVIGQANRPVIVYLNGEYWGIHQWQEHFNEVDLRRRFELGNEGIDLIEVNGKPRAGDAEAFHRLMEFADSEESGAVEAILERIDVGNFIDHFITQIFFANTDWPGNNIACWRVRVPPDGARAESPRDGRWRWLTFGTEAGLGLGGDVTHRSIERLLDVTKADGSSAPWSTALFRRLMTHTPFRFHFLARFASLLNHEFRQNRILDAIEVKVEELLELIRGHSDRWGRPRSVGHWLEELVRVRLFAIERPAIQREQLKDSFGFAGNAVVDFETTPSDAGRIVIQGLNQGGQPIVWEARSGVYFEGIPLALKAVANPGYRFVGWNGAFRSDSTVRFYIPVDGQRIVAEFVDVDPFQDLGFALGADGGVVSIVLENSVNPDSVRWERSSDLVVWSPFEPRSPLVESHGKTRIRIQVRIPSAELRDGTGFFRAALE